MIPINRDGNKGEDTDTNREDGYVPAKLAQDETCKNQSVLSKVLNPKSKILNHKS